MSRKQPFLFNNMTQSNQCRVELDKGALVFYSPYHPALLAKLKSMIPFSERKWDQERKAWLIAAGNEDILKDLAMVYFNDELVIPSVKNNHELSMALWEVHYIGMTKARENGEKSAYGYVEGEWKVIFPEGVLKAWFQIMPDAPGADDSLYAVLGVRNTVSVDDLKIAYRRLARQWHPDVCKEHNANEIFQRINKAYSILSDSNDRARYDAGLVFSATLGAQYQVSTNGYRSPLRCGNILCEGESILGRFLVSKILDWADITDAEGRILVTSWVMGEKEPMERWI